MLARFRGRIYSEAIGIRVMALLTAGMGVVNVLAAVRPSMQSRLRLLEQYSPLQVTHGGHLTSALAGFALLMLASGLWRRKRVAWLLTLLVLLASIVAHLLKGLDYEEASLAAILSAVLLMWRSHFHARSDLPQFVRQSGPWQRRLRLRSRTASQASSCWIGILACISAFGPLPARR